MLGRAILIVTGLILGCGAALVFLPVAAFLDPVTREAGAALGFFGLTSAAGALMAGEADRIAALGAALSTGLFAICVLPLVLTALIGEAARTRSFLWYAGGTGALAAAMPAILRAGLRGAGRSGLGTSAGAGPVEQRFLLLFFLTGIVAGGLYWLVAARGAMRPQPRPKVSSNE